MPNSTLFVCRSCHQSEQRPPEQPADGAVLCDRIQALHQSWSRQSELEVRGVDCLWTCDHPCSIALAADHRPTYALAKVLVKGENHADIAEAVLQLSERYLDSKSGIIPWKQFPEVLKTEFIACVPSSKSSDSGEAF
ncbi:DUF1636 domain-containing protein [Nodosilinea sp. LEGE 06152]|uniref:DUF1636 domain-containing protein n=1 Tax=Nodosilinea sp. LEGE 06152 TaxID=2777966 RepID=UPI00188182C9|nr:DUF1636 domain-containing protein [Nodosilinea sp. LEGE 06152]MBE9157487.1 DUF1636 domain-containing protein [Nodosilinea sp. LEGE 06152]